MGYLKDMRKKWAVQRELAIAQEENALAKLRAQTLAINTQVETIERFSNSGYSNGGASTRESWSKGYRSQSLSPDSDIEKNRSLLRERTRDLAMNAPLATAAINSTRSNVVGSGLVPRPKIDYEFLGIKKEDALNLQATIKKEWALWAESTLCDSNDSNNFYELQQIAFLDWLKNGEEFALIKYDKKLSYSPYQLRIKLVEADRISTEHSMNGEYDGIRKKLKNGNSVMNGVEISPSGKVVAYYISSVFPGEYDNKEWKWERIEKRGKRTGNPNILHVFNAERADQYRGVPFLAPVIQAIKQLTRYTEAEIMAAVVNSILAIFICTEDAQEPEGFGGDDGDWNASPIGRSAKEDEEIELGPGTITYLDKGESVNPVESKHPSGNYDAFVQAMTCQIGAALEIAPEVLLKRFSNNFSASKGALNETWRAFQMRRKWFVNDFCQEVYNLWLAEAVSKGRINAPGFFTDPLIQKAYSNATWNGPAQGNLNPVQEVGAAVTRIKNGLSTHEDECAAMNGSDYDDNVRTLTAENEKLMDANRSLKEI